MINERAKALITEEKYGQYAPIFQELISRAIKEYNLSPEYVDEFVQSCPKIRVGKMPKGVEWGLAIATENKEIVINKKVIKSLKKENTPEAYEYFLHVINHEMYHFLNDNKKQEGMNFAWNEALTEVSANRTTFGKNKEHLKEYRAQTTGYSNLTFGVNILAAAMGCSEKKLIQLAFEHKIPEVLSKQLHYKRDAIYFLGKVGEELNKIEKATHGENNKKEELQQIQTSAYHYIYIMRKRPIKPSNYA